MQLVSLVLTRSVLFVGLLFLLRIIRANDTLVGVLRRQSFVLPRCLLGATPRLRALDVLLFQPPQKTLGQFLRRRWCIITPRCCKLALFCLAYLVGAALLTLVRPPVLGGTPQA